MPNLKASKKGLRVSKRRNAINTRRKKVLRAALKDAREAIASGDAKRVSKAVPAATKALDRTAQKGTLHSNTAARLKSRLVHASQKKTESANAK